MDFKTAYQEAIKCEGFSIDNAQATAVEQLDVLYKQLVGKNNNSGLQQLWTKLTYSGAYSNSSQGCYLWGDVGRGKTWLMDLFYQSLPFKDKSRLHFHEFMQQIHLRLKAINGKQDPLITVARDIATNNRLICLDEFHVSDISDAMLLYGLLEALYKKDVILLMTSNTHPDELYKNGLQRSRFLPAIELIKKRNLLLHVDGFQDHRLAGAKSSANYMVPLTPDSDTLLEERFYEVAQGPIASEGPILVNNRVMNHKMMAANTIWFEFEELCAGPRAASDYLFLAKNYDYVIISNVFKMDASNDVMAKRFINLVDALYDRQINLMLSATAQPGDLYQGNRFQKEFKRTASRLEEMRSKDSLSSDRSALFERNTLLYS